MNLLRLGHLIFLMRALSDFMYWWDSLTPEERLEICILCQPE